MSQPRATNYSDSNASGTSKSEFLSQEATERANLIVIHEQAIAEEDETFQPKRGNLVKRLLTVYPKSILALIVI